MDLQQDGTVVVDLMPDRLDRYTSPQALPETVARLLQHVDINYMSNRLRRGAGICRLSDINLDTTYNIDGATSITSMGVFHQRNGRRILIVGTAGGILKTFPGDGSQDSSGPLPQCDDRVDFDSCCGSGDGNADDPGTNYNSGDSTSPCSGVSQNLRETGSPLNSGELLQFNELSGCDDPCSSYTALIDGYTLFVSRGACGSYFVTNINGDIVTSDVP